jgi:alpha-L-fucosidase
MSTADDQALQRIRDAAQAGPFRPEWDALAAFEIPGWYQDAKFGIFIHWGVFSVPGFNNEWYPRNMYKQGTPEFEHHVATYGPHRDFGYKDFIPQFTAEHFDPDDWAVLFKQAGARFVVPVAEHHDGFAMYDTDRSRWKAAAMGPKRDVIGELAEAVRRQWLVFGVSSHRAEHWWFMNGGAQFDSDVRDPEFADLYGPAAPSTMQPNEQFLEDWLLRTVELVDRYRPQLMWFDWWIGQPSFEPYVRRFAAYYYNQARRWDRGVVINYKWDAFRPGTAVYDLERGQMGDLRPDVWQNDTAVSKTSWAWVEGQDYKSLGDLVDELVDVVAKNGVLLLNIGPKPDGTIAREERELLEGIGRWLGVNGEAIYGTRPWRVAGEGPTEVLEGSFTDGERPPFTAEDIRFTMRRHPGGDSIYALVMQWPDDGVVRIRSLGTASGLVAGAIDTVGVLGHPGEVTWERAVDGLEVRLPGERPSEHGVTVKIKLLPPRVVGRHNDDDL